MMSVSSRVGSITGAIGAVITSTAVSICCIGPLGIAILGVNGAILAAAVKPYRFVLLTGSFLLLAYAHWTMRRGRRGAGATCSVRTGRFIKVALWTATTLWFAALVVQFAADRYWI